MFKNVTTCTVVVKVKKIYIYDKTNVIYHVVLCIVKKKAQI
jgi:hypothetical protein